MVRAMKKRGLSDVVTTVLIILLVLAAVAILGRYLLGFVNKGGAQISGATACSTLDLKPVACNATATAGTVRYERGAGQATLTNVSVIYTYADGSTSVDSASPLIPGNLGSFAYTNSSLGSKPVSAAVAGTVRTETGDSKLCEKTSAVQCT